MGTSTGSRGENPISLTVRESWGEAILGRLNDNWYRRLLVIVNRGLIEFGISMEHHLREERWEE
jgi:hypothetical protein